MELEDQGVKYYLFSETSPVDDAQRRAAYSETTGADICEFRRRTRLTQRQLARDLKITERYLRELEYGRQGPGPDLARRIAELMKQPGPLEVAQCPREVTLEAPIHSAQALQRRIDSQEKSIFELQGQVRRLENALLEGQNQDRRLEGCVLTTERDVRELKAGAFSLKVLEARVRSLEPPVRNNVSSA
jgi:transcriptional regulator with XRE-family HTH domain